ncbi:hypothetical protein SLE2022_073030 [Rubroshorea leprosula]
MSNISLQLSAPLPTRSVFFAILVLIPYCKSQTDYGPRRRDFGVYTVMGRGYCLQCIVIISLTVERTLHYVGKYLKKKDQKVKPLFEARQKIKEELMLLGFISLLLTVFQDRISKFCMSVNLANKWLPCSKDSEKKSTISHSQTFFSSILPRATVRHLLAASSSSSSSESLDPAAAHCKAKGKVPLLSLTELHHLHIFVFVLAVVHVIFCALTILLGKATIRRWKQWEESAPTKKDYNPEQGIASINNTS